MALSIPLCCCAILPPSELRVGYGERPTGESHRHLFGKLSPPTDGSSLRGRQSLGVFQRKFPNNDIHNAEVVQPDGSYNVEYIVTELKSAGVEKFAGRRGRTDTRRPSGATAADEKSGGRNQQKNAGIRTEGTVFKTHLPSGRARRREDVDGMRPLTR